MAIYAFMNLLSPLSSHAITVVWGKRLDLSKLLVLIHAIVLIDTYSLGPHGCSSGPHPPKEN